MIVGMKKCDLVMKGGITSGIVYPGAVLELSKEFEFANIGGTSAGAIAAAITAAAEYRRQNGGGSAGFERIAQLPAWMAETIDGRSRLLWLFQPTGETVPLFDIALAYIEKKKWTAVLSALLRGFPAYGSMIAFIGIALMVVAALAADHIAIAVVIAALAVITAISVVIASVIEMLVFANRTLPKHGFGVSSGIALATWLADEVDGVANVAQPLTFGDLRKAGVNLEMMTTNLTHGRPYRLPFEERNLYFTPEEMRQLFPERIVQWMLDHAEVKRERYALPSDDLPIVVATRMSLSFPLLLSAVPLWAIDFGRRTDTHEAERCWFSDGGITSNFPVHFFDAPIPRWPTFAINLGVRSPRYHSEGQRIYVPRTNRGGIMEWWTPFDDLFGFLTRIVSTMQNWRDNMLLHLPGQRDRIAHVLLGPQEGGLNLTMDPATIADVASRGAEAGRAFREQFRWTNHKWVRFLSFTSALEDALERWESAFDDTTEPPAYRELVSGPMPLPSYKVSAEERAAMRDASLAFLAHVRANFGKKPFRKPRRRPREQPVLRAMPRT